jgi:hypothetical protein
MKKKLLSLTVIVLSLCIFSTSSFAQIDPGGSGDPIDPTIPPEGSGTVPSTYSFKSFTFKRNNGNGYGVCGSNAQVRVEFNPMPVMDSDIPKLTSIMYQGVNLINNTDVRYPSVMSPVATIINQTQPYVSYCLTGSFPGDGASGGNIPPAEKLTLKFNNQ